MEVSGQLQAPSAIPPEKKLSVPIGQESGWAPDPTFCKFSLSYFLFFFNNLLIPAVQVLYSGFWLMLIYYPST